MIPITCIYCNNLTNIPIKALTFSYNFICNHCNIHYAGIKASDEDPIIIFAICIPIINNISLLIDLDANDVKLIHPNEIDIIITAPLNIIFNLNIKQIQDKFIKLLAFI